MYNTSLIIIITENRMQPASPKYHAMIWQELQDGSLIGSFAIILRLVLPVALPPITISPVSIKLGHFTEYTPLWLTHTTIMQY